MAMPMEEGKTHWLNKYSLPANMVLYPDKFICSHFVSRWVLPLSSCIHQGCV